MLAQAPLGDTSDTSPMTVYVVTAFGSRAFTATNEHKSTLVTSGIRAISFTRPGAGCRLGDASSDSARLQLTMLSAAATRACLQVLPRTLPK
jgi:hypothetical protein